MKIIFTLFAAILSVFSVLAQPDETSRRSFHNEGRLSVSTVNNEPVRVLVDGNFYNSNGNDKDRVYNNIRPGYHSIKIFQQKKYRHKNDPKLGKNMKLIYEGNFYVKPAYHVDILVNRFGKAFIDEKLINSGYDDDHDYNWPAGWNNNIQAMNTRAFEQFKQVLRKEGFDQTRLVVAKQTISSNNFSSQQVKEIVQLFSYENSKLDMAKYCYRYTVDKNNYFMLNDAFDFSNSKEELARFIQAYR